MSATRFSIEAIFRGIDKFSAPVARMTTTMDRFTRRVRKGMMGIGKMTKRMARGFRNSALTLGSLGVMGGFALKGLFGPAMRFQHAMDGVNAVTLGAYSKHMPALSEAALELGKNTTFTATQVANAMEILAKSGLSAPETMGLIGPTLLGAEASGSDISTMADILVSTIAQMQSLDAMRDGERVINAYAVAASSANTTMEELGEGMKKTIPIGETLNFAFEDMLATTTLLQHMGIEASMTGSQQRTFFTRLASLTPKAAKSFRQMGIEVLDANKDMKKLPELLAAIAAGFKKVSGNAPKLKKMAEAVGLRGGVAGNILIRNMDELEALLLRIADLRDGAGQKMASMRLDNLYGALVRLKSAWEFFRIQIGTSSLPELESLVDSLSKLLTDPANIKLFKGYIEDSVKALKEFWGDNKDFLFEFMRVMWGLTKLVSMVMWFLVKLGTILTGSVLKGFGGSWGVATAISAALPFEDDFNKWMGGLSPDADTGYEDHQALMSRPSREDEVYGVIRVEAEPGTRATVDRETQKGPVNVVVPSSGSFGGMSQRNLQ